MSASCMCIENAYAVDFAYQPIISTSSFRVHGFEALARLGDDRFDGVCDLLDCAYAHGVLGRVEQVLLRKAIGKFAQFDDARAVRLFCNLDNRAYDGIPDNEEAIVELISGAGLPPSNLCLEISERGPVSSSENLRRAVDLLGRRDVRIALDDFGIGTSGLNMLLMVEPHYVKIDRSFIDGISSNTRKQAIVSKLCGMAHALGFQTIAEGVETASDFRAARDLGCDFAQGYHIARPTVALGDLGMVYAQMLGTPGDRAMSPRVAELLTPIEAVCLDQPLSVVVDMFKARPELRLVPVVDRSNIVQGAVLEEEVRSFMLSDFGPSLLANRGVDSRIGKLLHRCPIGEAHGTVEAIVNSYVASESANGLILAADGRYAGYLSNHAVLRLASEREVLVAREQNPLTQLPGNQSITRHVEELLSSRGPSTLAFFDFDHFKAFNDAYGFAAGDRALLLFADLLRGLSQTLGAFAGHIGGDDFFLSLAIPGPSSEQLVRELQRKFAEDVQHLYSPGDRAQGGITAVDRFGHTRFFPLLQVSAGILHLPHLRSHLDVQAIKDQLSGGKIAAKRAEDKLAVMRLPEASLDEHEERAKRAA